jgi:hypothetical protein
VAVATIEQAQERAEAFLIGQMLDALRAVEYRWPRFDEAPQSVALAEAVLAQVAVRHVRGASDALYLVAAFDDELLMQLQLNVWRLVVVYSVPASPALDALTLAARLERWRLGAEHAGWTIGWREAASPQEAGQRFVETYCYAAAAPDFLENALQQLYWRTDIVQMTRYFMLEARRCAIALSPRRAGYAL